MELGAAPKREELLGKKFGSVEFERESFEEPHWRARADARRGTSGTNTSQGKYGLSHQLSEHGIEQFRLIAEQRAHGEDPTRFSRSAFQSPSHIGRVPPLIVPFRKRSGCG